MNEPVKTEWTHSKLKRSSFIKVYTVCHFGLHSSTVITPSLNFRIIKGCCDDQLLRMITVV